MHCSQSYCNGLCVIYVKPIQYIGCCEGHILPGSECILYKYMGHIWQSYRTQVYVHIIFRQTKVKTRTQQKHLQGKHDNNAKF